MRYSIIMLIVALACPFGTAAQWIESLPSNVQAAILLAADHEEANLNDWTLDQYQYPGGGIFNTGGTDVSALASSAVAHSGQYAAEAIITNAWQSQNGSRAVRLMRWTDTAWDNGGVYFPTKSFYSVWYYFPTTYNPNKYVPWDPGDGGWWNIFQFKSHDENDVSQPVWTLNVEHDDAAQEMSLYLYTKENTPNSYGQNSPIAIPVGQWVHLEIYYQASTPNTPDGHITVWQDGVEILNVSNVITTLDDGVVIWGIGNYTDRIDGDPIPGKATLYFDDAIVSESALHPYASCLDFPTNTWTGANGASWLDPTNWSESFSPIACQHVVIPANATVNIPANAQISIRELTLSNSATLIVPDSASITVSEK